MRLRPSESPSQSQREVWIALTIHHARLGQPCMEHAQKDPRSLFRFGSSYLDQLLAENRRLKEQSVTSADGTEANDPPHAERYVTLMNRWPMLGTC